MNEPDMIRTDHDDSYDTIILGVFGRLLGLTPLDDDTSTTMKGGETPSAFVLLGSLDSSTTRPAMLQTSW